MWLTDLEAEYEVHGDLNWDFYDFLIWLSSIDPNSWHSKKSFASEDGNLFMDLLRLAWSTELPIWDHVLTASPCFTMAHGRLDTCACQTSCAKRQRISHHPHMSRAGSLKDTLPHALAVSTLKHKNNIFLRPTNFSWSTISFLHIPIMGQNISIIIYPINGQKV